MAKALNKGDAVKWSTPQGETLGKVEGQVTAPMNIKGHRVHATPKNPQYLVTSSKSGKPAAHRAEALKKIGKLP